MHAVEAWNRAVGQSPLRAFLRFLLLIGAVSCSSCISTPKKLGGLVSPEGALMTSVLRLGPLSLIRTGSIVPGQIPYSSKNTKTGECGDGNVRATVEMSSAGQFDPEAACDYLLLGISYTTRNLGVSQTDLELLINFVPKEHSIYRREHFWAFNKKPRASYWIPVLSSQMESLANMVSSISHEMMHLLAGTNRMAPDIAMSERIGHLMGACAELEVIGELRRDRLSLTHFNENLDLPSNVMRSSLAGAQVSRDLLPFFEGASFVSRESKAGKRMSAYCSSELPRIIANPVAREI